MWRQAQRPLSSFPPIFLKHEQATGQLLSSWPFRETLLLPIGLVPITHMLSTTPVSRSALLRLFPVTLSGLTHPAPPLSREIWHPSPRQQNNCISQTWSTEVRRTGIDVLTSNQGHSALLWNPVAVGRDNSRAEMEPWINNWPAVGAAPTHLKQLRPPWRTACFYVMAASKIETVTTAGTRREISSVTDGLYEHRLRRRESCDVFWNLAVLLLLIL